MLLSEAGEGSVIVSRISERLEMDDDALALIAEARLIPGSEAIVVGRDALGNVSVKTGAGDQVVPVAVARMMDVVPGDANREGVGAGAASRIA
jgi:hypothetical protein